MPYDPTKKKAPLDTPTWTPPSPAEAPGYPVPSLFGHPSTGATPAAAAPAAPALPAPSMAERGAATRQAVGAGVTALHKAGATAAGVAGLAGAQAINAPLAAAETSANFLTRPLRTQLGNARDFVNGFTGAPASPHAGQPTAGFDLGRVDPAAVTAAVRGAAPVVAGPLGAAALGVQGALAMTRGAPAPAAAPAAPAPARSPLPNTPAVAEGAKPLPLSPAAAPSAPARAPSTAAAPAPVIGTANGKPITAEQATALAGQLGTVTGTAAAVPAAPAAPTIIAPQATAAAAAPAGAVIANPDSRDAEIRDVIFRSNLDAARNRSERSAIAGAHQQDEAARAAAALAETNGNRELRAGDARNATAVAQGNAQLGLTAQTANATNAYQQAALAQQGQLSREQLASQQAIAKAQLDKPELITGADGTTYRVSGGQAAAVTDGDGQPIRQQVPGAVTPKDVYTTEMGGLNAELKALEANAFTMKPEEVAARRSEIYGRMEKARAGVAGSQGEDTVKPGAIAFDTFAARAKAQGSKMTPEQLREAYNSYTAGR